MGGVVDVVSAVPCGSRDGTVSNTSDAAYSGSHILLPSLGRGAHLMSRQTSVMGTKGTTALSRTPPASGPGAPTFGSLRACERVLIPNDATLPIVLAVLNAPCAVLLVAFCSMSTTPRRTSSFCSASATAGQRKGRGRQAGIKQGSVELDRCSGRDRPGAQATALQCMDARHALRTMCCLVRASCS